MKKDLQKQIEEQQDIILSSQKHAFRRMLDNPLFSYQICMKILIDHVNEKAYEEPHSDYINKSLTILQKCKEDIDNLFKPWKEQTNHDTTQQPTHPRHLHRPHRRSHHLIRSSILHLPILPRDNRRIRRKSHNPIQKMNGLVPNPFQPLRFNKNHITSNLVVGSKPMWYIEGRLRSLSKP